ARSYGENVEGTTRAVEGRDPRRLPEIVPLHHAPSHPALDRPQRAIPVDAGREHGVRQDERLVASNPRGGSAVRARHDHLPGRQVQRTAAFRTTDRFEELGHASTTLMARVRLAVPMGY